ncbi:hypothetical protein [Xanthocytophaga agilis]|uniref:Uncharacterized protein n=1 Tax=Xanthocytophaga agilis TaxID=3048010 RepID=A0AAE3R2Z3_9BACT|nr:hypothetical protein [Xanthocytophaga agilis]MDJ1500689.1 hypothetical protein [Xanthocytophaga agilis]
MILKTKLGKELLWNVILLGIATSIVFASFDVRFLLDEGNVIDIQLHDTYFVIGYFHFIVLLWIVFVLGRYCLLGLAYLSKRSKIAAGFLLLLTALLAYHTLYFFFILWHVQREDQKFTFNALYKSLAIPMAITLAAFAGLIYCGMWLGRQLFSTSKQNS